MRDQGGAQKPGFLERQTRVKTPPSPPGSFVARRDKVLKVLDAILNSFIVQYRGEIREDEIRWTVDFIQMGGGTPGNSEKFQESLVYKSLVLSHRKAFCFQPMQAADGLCLFKSLVIGMAYADGLENLYKRYIKVSSEREQSLLVQKAQQLREQLGGGDSRNTLKAFEKVYPHRVRVFNGLCEVSRRAQGKVINILFDEGSQHVVLIRNVNEIACNYTHNKKFCEFCCRHYRPDDNHRCPQKLESECRECNFVFATVDGMNRHRTTSAAFPARHCPSCNKRFFTKNDGSCTTCSRTANTERGETRGF